MILDECICGNRMVRIFAEFDGYDIAGWMLEAECVQCGSRFKTPTPVDDPDYIGE